MSQQHRQVIDSVLSVTSDNDGARHPCHRVWLHSALAQAMRRAVGTATFTFTRCTRSLPAPFTCFVTSSYKLTSPQRNHLSRCSQQ